MNIEDYLSSKLIDFAIHNAGKKILDVGCANGDYIKILQDNGFNCTGIDINPEYIDKALEKGLNAYVMRGDNLDFPDNSFDTILLFEVLEHVENPLEVLKELKRVAKKNILITVPNCTHFSELKRYNLTYEHMLEKDHINFFTKKDLKDLLSKEFKYFKVVEEEPIPLTLLSVKNMPSWLRYFILLLNKFNIINDNIYYRLYAVIEVD